MGTTSAVKTRGTFRHGHNARGKRSPTYRAWAHMLERCRNPNSPDFPDYGGRGITVCERWVTFENFLSDMGVRPDGMSIDRINNDVLVDGYSKNNCRWATPLEQSRNRRCVRLNHRLARQIRFLCEMGYAKKAVARMYGVYDSTIKKVVDGVFWPEPDGE